MKQKVKHFFKIILGWFFIVLGIIGCFLPILQGILFMLIGLFLLAHEYTWAGKVFDKIKERFPGAYAKFQGWQKKREKRAA